MGQLNTGTGVGISLAWCGSEPDAAASLSNLLLESGDNLLLESGDFLLLEV